MAEEMRPAIIKLHEKGVPKREIGRLLDVNEATVRKHIKRFEETGSHQNKPKGRPEKTARNRRNIKRAKAKIQRNPSTRANSKRKLAKKLGKLRMRLWRKSWTTSRSAWRNASKREAAISNNLIILFVFIVFAKTLYKIRKKLKNESAYVHVDHPV